MPSEDYFQWAASILDPSKAFEKPEALADIKIIELSMLVLASSLSSYLSELGAMVFKVELPGTGDIMRSFSPFARFYKGAGLGWLKEARNKYHLGIDVRVQDGKELFLDLVKRSDVVVENLKVGTMDRWGIGYRQLKEINPKIVYISLNGFGQWGPYKDRPSYDAIAQAESGMASITGFPERLPLKSGIWLADYFGGLMGAVGVLGALSYRDRTGEGQYIEYSQVENLMRVMDWTWLGQHLTGEERSRTGNRDVAICPSDIFPCRDAVVAVGAATEAQFRGLCEAMEKPELASDQRFATHGARLREENAVVLLEIIRRWAEEKTYSEIDALACLKGFGAEKVCDGKDHFHDEHLVQRNFTTTVHDPLYGDVVEEGVVPKLSETPGRIKWAGKPVGFDNEFVLKRFLGKTSEEIRTLTRRKAIGKWVEGPPGRTPPPDWDGEDGRILT